MAWKQIVVSRVEAWYRPEYECTCVGRILSRKVRNSDDTYYYLVELLEPCEAVNADAEVITLKPGSIMGLGETAALTVLTDHIGKVVKVKPLGKRTISGGRSFWDYEISYQE